MENFVVITSLPFRTGLDPMTETGSLISKRAACGNSLQNGQADVEFKVSTVLRQPKLAPGYIHFEAIILFAGIDSQRRIFDIPFFHVDRELPDRTETHAMPVENLGAVYLGQIVLLFHLVTCCLCSGC